MTGELEAILARVAAGELSPEAAEPLVAAAMPAQPAVSPSHQDEPDEAASSAPDPAAAGGVGARGPRRVVRVRVIDGGRHVVDLRIPLSLASLAGAVIPGLTDPQLSRIAQAIRDGETGTILDVRDEDGSGVVIATE